MGDFLVTKTTAILSVCLWLCACGQGEQTKEKKPEAMQEWSKQMFAALPTDSMLAEAELEKRLDASVKVSDGLLIVHADPSLGGR